MCASGSQFVRGWMHDEQVVGGERRFTTGNSWVTTSVPFAVDGKSIRARKMLISPILRLCMYEFRIFVPSCVSCRFNTKSIAYLVFEYCTESSASLVRSHDSRASLLYAFMHIYVMCGIDVHSFIMYVCYCVSGTTRRKLPSRIGCFTHWNDFLFVCYARKAGFEVWQILDSCFCMMSVCGRFLFGNFLFNFSMIMYSCPILIGVKRIWFNVISFSHSPFTVGFVSVLRNSHPFSSFILLLQYLHVQ